MRCPNCKKLTERYVAQADKKTGNVEYCCIKCSQGFEGLSLRIRRKFRSRRQREFDSYELPKDVIKSTQKLAPKKKYPDSPILRDLGNTVKKNRTLVYDYGDTSKSSRNVRVMNKLINKLGSNPKILSDDGFRVLAESTIL